MQQPTPARAVRSPDSPRITHALTLLAEELNAMTASPPGDNRALTYQLATP